MLAAKLNSDHVVEICSLLHAFGANINEGLGSETHGLYFAAANKNHQLIINLTRWGAVGGKCVCAALDLDWNSQSESSD
jgi:hypothetical protein